MDVMIEGRNSGMDGDFGAEEEEFNLNLFHFWDFPPENVISDDFVGDRDDSGLERLEPMGLDALMSPTIRRRKVTTFPMDAHIDEKPKHLPDYVGIASGSCILDQNVSTETRESVALQTQTPDSAVGISSWCSTGTFGAIPVQPRSRTTRPHLKPWNPMSPWHPTKPGSGSTSNYRKHKERKRLLGNAVYGLQSSDSEQQPKLQPVGTRKCTHCEITKTPQWRGGPLGPKTLCNACGVRYRSGCLFPEYRPAASPTFVPDLHSSSHKKVLEMRNKATPHATKTY